MEHDIFIWIYLGCVIFAGLLWGEYQTIIFVQRGMKTFKAWFGGWWSKITMPKNKVLLWLVRYPLAWFRDGFHNVPFVTITLLVLPLIIHIVGSVLTGVEYYLTAMVIFGIFANISLHDLFTKLLRKIWKKNAYLHASSRKV